MQNRGAFSKCRESSEMLQSKAGSRNWELGEEDACDIGGHRADRARLKDLVCYAEVLVLQAVTLQSQGNELG